MTTAASQTPRTLIDAVDLTKRFGDRPAVDRLSFEVRSGELYCLLGPEGSGKTTAVNLLMGFTSASEGRALVCGVDPRVHPIEARRQIAFISMHSALYGAISPRRNIEFFTRLALNRPVTRGAAYDAMRQFGIPERSFEKKVSTLPQELRLSLWLAIASLRQTPVIILDEPTFGLDSRASADLQEHLAEFRRQGKAVLLATTDVLLASQIADRIGMLKQGRKVAERTHSQMLGLSLNELHFDYVGRPPRPGTSPLHDPTLPPS